MGAGTMPFPRWRGSERAGVIPNTWFSVGCSARSVTERQLPCSPEQASERPPFDPAQGDPRGGTWVAR